MVAGAVAAALPEKANAPGDPAADHVMPTDGGDVGAGSRSRAIGITMEPVSAGTTCPSNCAVGGTSSYHAVCTASCTSVETIPPGNPGVVRQVSR